MLCPVEVRILVHILYRTKKTRTYLGPTLNGADRKASLALLSAPDNAMGRDTYDLAWKEKTQ